MIELLPVRGVPEIQAGDDLAQVVLDALAGSTIELHDGDVVVVTQKVVSKAEGRVVPELPVGKAGWVQRETRRVVARRGDLVIVETPHGFVCANAGVDASNVGEGLLSLLPEDPDGSAARLRARFEEASGRRLAVVVTDTFGRAWRHGLVNVAIGCAGLPSLIDLRGKPDATGRELEVTIEALADEVAAASGLVMGKADGVPVAVVRGVDIEGPDLPARSLVRRRAEDLFPESPEHALDAARPGSVLAGEPDEELELRARSSVAASWQRWLPTDLLGVEVRFGGGGVLATTLEDLGFRSAGAPQLVCVFLPADRADAGAGAGLRLGIDLHAAGLAFDWFEVGPDLRDRIGRVVEGSEGTVPVGILAIGLEH